MFVQVLKLMFTQPSQLNEKLINFKQGSKKYPYVIHEDIG